MRHTHAYQHLVHNVAADYNLRIPHYIRHAILLGVVVLVGAVILSRILPADQSGLAVVAGIIGLLLAAPFIAVWTILKIMQNRRFAIRDRILNTLHWHGDEQVLDVGTGSGIMLFGCAKRLKTGKAVGIDIYLPNAGGGTEDVFWRNAHIEGVHDRVDLQNVDVRKMPYPDASFDVIVSSFAMHHIGHSAADRGLATREMLRVLKPGGTIALYDVAVVMNACQEEMKSAGVQEVRTSGKTLMLLTARKAG
jgi:arsenite methyltransferase